MRRLLPLLAAVALVAVAVALHLTTPDTEESLAPFVVRAEPGQWAEGRSVAARVDGVQVAARVTDGDWTGTTGGVWVVVSMSAETRLDPTTVAASLRLGERRYDASARGGTSTLDGLPLSPGLPSRGDVVFEVPAAALEAHGGSARLRVGERFDPELDSAVEVPVDLTAVATVPEVVLGPVERTTR